MNSSSNLINALFIFVLAGFIGFEVIRRVSPLLHTPLMSLTNALDAIAVVGAIVLVGEHRSTLSAVFGFIAVVAATSNIIGVPLGRVHMTAVPQRTALSHAFGALCVTLVGSAEYYLRAPDISRFMMAVLSLEVILGGLTVTGSLMAAGKLQEILPQRPLT